MTHETNVVTSYSAGAITDLMPEGMYDTLLKNITILTNNPTGERIQEYHGGIEFDIEINNRRLHWRITHNFNDYFDLELIPTDEFNLMTNTLTQVEHDLGNGDLKNVFETLWADYLKFMDEQKSAVRDVLSNIIDEMEEE